MMIGIPHYNDLEGLKKVEDSLRKSTKIDAKIIIINSSEELKDEIERYFKYSNVEIINTPKLGPLDAYNRLFEIAKERKEDLFLTQTDVYFPNCKKNWLQEVIQISKYKNCGLVTCWGGGGTSGPDFINGFNWVGAWFIYIPYKTIEKVGSYDMNIPLGYGVDIDYSYAVKEAGLKTYVVDYWVYHTPNYDRGHDWEKEKDFMYKKQEAFRYMKRKWNIK